jgi:hypothetical protein
LEEKIVDFGRNKRNWGYKICGNVDQHPRQQGPVWFLATFCQAKVWLAIKVWQPQKVWQRNMKPNFGKSWQQQ